jgi:uncharacterized protein (DUF58 family)
VAEDEAAAWAREWFRPDVIMSDSTTEYRRYLEPRTLARIGSLDLRARLVVEGLMAGMHRSPYHGISVEFAQHRQYVPGDDIRHVDWKVFAKTDKVYLKQYQEETNLHLICVVDASESMGYGSVGSGDAVWSKYDHATAIAASLAYLAIQQQDSVGLAIFDNDLRRYFKPSNSPAQWKTITHELLLVPRLKKTGTGRVLDQLAEKLTHRSVVVLLSDFFDDIASVQHGLRHLRYRKHEVIAFQILDPMEVEFPFEDVTLFKGMEEMGELLTEPQSLRQGYLAELGAWTNELKQLCRGMHIDFTQMNSGQPLDVALSSFLAVRAASIR